MEGELRDGMRAWRKLHANEIETELNRQIAALVQQLVRLRPIGSTTPVSAGWRRFIGNWMSLWVPG